MTPPSTDTDLPQCGGLESPAAAFLSEALVSVVGPALARLLTQPGLGLLLEVECEATSPASDLLLTQWDTALRLQVRCASGVCLPEYCTTSSKH